MYSLQMVLYYVPSKQGVQNKSMWVFRKHLATHLKTFGNTPDQSLAGPVVGMAHSNIHTHRIRIHNYYLQSFL